MPPPPPSPPRYANRAKNIKNKPRINEDPKDAMLREFQDEIARLKAMLEVRGRRYGRGRGGDCEGEEGEGGEGKGLTAKKGRACTLPPSLSELHDPCDGLPCMLAAGAGLTRGSDSMRSLSHSPILLIFLLCAGQGGRLLPRNTLPPRLLIPLREFNLVYFLTVLCRERAAARASAWGREAWWSGWCSGPRPWTPRCWRG